MEQIRAGILTLLFLSLAGGQAYADDNPAPIKSAETKSFEFKIGLAAGGPVGLLFPVKGIEEHTTQPVSTVFTSRMRFPKVSPRVLELYAVYPNGFGLNIKNDDFHFGDVRLHLFDLGLFYNAREPVSVQRVKRDWDITIGFGIEWKVKENWVAILDWRAFVPLNIPRVISDYGDFSRLILYESFQGGQAWAGLLHCF